MRASRGIGGATMISSIGVHTYETYNATKKAIKKYRKRKKKKNTNCRLPQQVPCTPRILQRVRCNMHTLLYLNTPSSLRSTFLKALFPLLLLLLRN